jgi:pimeloyl-ACP methyl ester carboxylesterase
MTQRMAALRSALAFLASLIVFSAWGQVAGVVVMHGKGGSPQKFVDTLASYLQEKGHVVANLEMAWSGGRNYDVDVATAEKEVEAALDGLRAKGAKKLFVAGHSQGGLFALYFGTGHAVDGVIAIAPGGSTGSGVFREKLGASYERAKTLVAQGKGAEKERLQDYEGSRGIYPVVAPPSSYVTWFDPEGAMNEGAAVKKIKPATPVLFIVPTGDYPLLQKVKPAMFGALPPNPLTKLYEPDSSHVQAPSASREEIARWIAEVMARKGP